MQNAAPKFLCPQPKIESACLRFTDKGEPRRSTFYPAHSLLFLHVYSSFLAFSFGTSPRMRKPQDCHCKLTNVYYEEILEANPGNPLPLRNHAKFLHEVKGDTSKAGEFYERAVMAGPEDGEVLSLCAQLIWETHKDVDRAQAYFDQAVETATHDCYLIASYANFLWKLEVGGERWLKYKSGYQQILAPEVIKTMRTVHFSDGKPI